MDLPIQGLAFAPAYNGNDDQTTKVETEYGNTASTHDDKDQVPAPKTVASALSEEEVLQEELLSHGEAVSVAVTEPAHNLSDLRAKPLALPNMDIPETAIEEDEEENSVGAEEIETADEAIVKNDSVEDVENKADFQYVEAAKAASGFSSHTESQTILKEEKYDEDAKGANEMENEDASLMVFMRELDGELDHPIAKAINHKPFDDLITPVTDQWLQKAIDAQDGSVEAASVASEKKSAVEKKQPVPDDDVAEALDRSMKSNSLDASSEDNRVRSTDSRNEKAFADDLSEAVSDADDVTEENAENGSSATTKTPDARTAKNDVVEKLPARESNTPDETGWISAQKVNSPEKTVATVMADDRINEAAGSGNIVWTIEDEETAIEVTVEGDVLDTETVAVSVGSRYNEQSANSKKDVSMVEEATARSFVETIPSASDVSASAGSQDKKPGAKAEKEYMMADTDEVVKDESVATPPSPDAREPKHEAKNPATVAIDETKLREEAELSMLEQMYTEMYLEIGSVNSRTEYTTDVSILTDDGTQDTDSCTTGMDDQPNALELSDDWNRIGSSKRQRSFLSFNSFFRRRSDSLRQRTAAPVSRNRYSGEQDTKGTSIDKASSSKSEEPVTVLSFRREHLLPPLPPSRKKQRQRQHDADDTTAQKHGTTRSGLVHVVGVGDMEASKLINVNVSTENDHESSANRKGLASRVFRLARGGNNKNRELTGKKKDNLTYMAAQSLDHEESEDIAGFEVVQVTVQ
ncbi:MAG: hypothetical protein SGARI_000259 [Bacillariaceae sp.]